MAYAFAARPGFFGDHLAWWFAARVLLDGGNPYAIIPNTAPWFINDPLMYPLTAVIGATPFAFAPLAISQGLFVGVGSALMAWGLAARGWHMLLVFLSFPFVMAANLGQWSPYIVAAMLVPWVGWTVAFKPNLGLAAFIYAPGRVMVLGAAALGALAFFIMPYWPWLWLESVRGGAPHPSPLFTLLGAPVVLALLRWRHPEARLLLAMAAVPQTSMFADQLPLFLVTRTRREMLVLAITSGVGGLVYVAAMRGGDTRALLIDHRFVTVAMYWPALLQVLLRPTNPERGQSNSFVAASPPPAAKPAH